MNLMFRCNLKNRIGKKVKAFRFSDGENSVEVRASNRESKREGRGECKIIFYNAYVHDVGMPTYPEYYFNFGNEEDRVLHRFLSEAPIVEAVFDNKKSAKVNLLFRGC